MALLELENACLATQCSPDPIVNCVPMTTNMDPAVNLTVLASVWNEEVAYPGPLEVETAPTALETMAVINVILVRMDSMETLVSLNVPNLASCTDFATLDLREVVV